MFKSLKFIIALSGILFLTTCKTSKYEYPFQNPELPVDERVEDLVSRLTTEEKASQLIYSAPAIERLGIPAYNWWNECLHGVARNGLATVFPQAIGLAAMFDTAQMKAIAEVISDEARAKYNKAISRGEHGIYQGLTFWTPNINIFRDPRWGRGMETYGEDPYLTGSMAVPFIKGLQGNNPKYFKTIATSKHFVVHSGPEPQRHEFNSIASERDLIETYYPHFRRTVQEANVQSIMCAYNRLDGEPCCGSGKLLNDLLRNEWGFNGYVVSDCWALVDFFNGHFVSDSSEDAAALALKSGTDLNCGVVYESLKSSLDIGLITEEDIDIAVKRLFKARFQLGMFDPESEVPFSKIGFDVVDSEKHKEIALETSRKSMVLLKNENKILPLSKDIKKVAVIGPNANDENLLLANYNGMPSKTTTPLEGIKEKLGSNAEVVYARGCDVAEGLPFLTAMPSSVLYTDSTLTQNGLVAKYFNSPDITDKPFKEEVISHVDYNWWDEAPVEGMKTDGFAVSWSGYFVPEVSGKHAIGGEGRSGLRIIFNNNDTIEKFSEHGLFYIYDEFVLEAGQAYPVTFEYYNAERIAMAKLLWDFPTPDLESEALKAASNSDVVIMFMGLSPKIEGEEMDVDIEGFKGGDRTVLGLPEVQLQLMKKIKATGKPIVLVLLNGSAIGLNWEKDNIPAILEAWYPGQAAGTAIADILFGDYNPSGRLPLTFYKSVKDLPPFEDYSMEGRTYKYFKGEPVYEFGYGLSYSELKYKNLNLPKETNKTDDITISVEIENLSEINGEEVVQVYLTAPETDFSTPIRSLVAFNRIPAPAKTTNHIEFTISKDKFVVYNDKGETIIPTGEYTLSVGGRQPSEEVLDNVVTGKIIVK
ncbi:MAG: glycoside hydrolase family 3 C-terminal domain-containing protein [Bacteroidales bacterium]|nr:glycoside hydrolase family 3 C-terminal domain-containing protein [Bacteroidales bacterium]MBN2818835.1 glycoside hydrolase family 3 C-terminal domain-containing protein [Bacteroidales bacterium]